MVHGVAELGDEVRDVCPVQRAVHAVRADVQNQAEEGQREHDGLRPDLHTDTPVSGCTRPSTIGTSHHLDIDPHRQQ